MANELKIGIIGKSGRLDAIATALLSSPSKVQLYALSEVESPGLISKCKVMTGITDNLDDVRRFAESTTFDFVVIGPEEPLAAGVVNLLEGMGIPCVGPRKATAKIESSKACARTLLAKHAPQYNPKYEIFSSSTGLKEFCNELEEFAIKPDGLTGGKGVKVFGDHFFSIEEGLDYCHEILSQHGASVVIEEKLDGEEFSLQSFCDGKSIKHMIPVQDHKRAFEGDEGPNTGGMGSYSYGDHGLPFTTSEVIAEAQRVNELVYSKIEQELGEPYRGILYGGFIVTNSGLKLIEYNARFGDPEVMNVLSLLENDFVEICQSIISQTLADIELKFQKKFSVCKYIVPESYPGGSSENDVLDRDSIAKGTDDLKVYFGAVNLKNDEYHLVGSRALAFVGIGDTLKEAEQIAERAAANVKGNVRHRSDIGKAQLIEKRVSHMRRLKSQNQSSKAPLREERILL